MICQRFCVTLAHTSVGTFGTFHLSGQKLTTVKKKKKKKPLKLIKFENKEWVIFLNWHKEHSQLSHTPSDLLHTQSAAHKLEHLSVVSCPCFQIIRKTQRRLKWLKTGCSAKSPSQRALYTLPGCNKKEKKKTTKLFSVPNLEGDSFYK